MAIKPPTRPIPIRLNEVELSAFKAEAQRQYGAPHKWRQLLRRYGQEGLARDRGENAETPSFDTYKRLADELAALRIELSRIGGNLNQIAHAVNLHDVVDGRALAGCHAELRAKFDQLAGFLRQVNSLLREVASGGLLHRRDRQE